MTLEVPRVEYRTVPATDQFGAYDAAVTDVFTEHGYSRLRGTYVLPLALQHLAQVRKRARHAENYGL